MAHKENTGTKTAIKDYSIPSWNELPNLDLYMDQVITLMEEYLSVYKKPEESVITPSMVNNYVKLGVIPKPYKKRYGRIHLAYLIMVCTFKQIMPISDVQKLLPLTLEEEDVKQAFNSFSAAQKEIFQKVAKDVTASQKRLEEKENATFADFFEEAVQVALTGNVYKILSVQIADHANTFSR